MTPNSRRATALPVALLSWVAATLGGCIGGELGDGDLGVPLQDAPLDDATWEALAGRGASIGGTRTDWPLPGILAIDLGLVGEDGASAAAVSLGSYGPYSSLPFFTGLEVRLYQREAAGAGGAVSGADYRSHLFWTWTDRIGAPPQRLHLDSWGVPLLYSEVGLDADLEDTDLADGARLDVTLRQALWTLGPTVLSLDAGEPDDAKLSATIVAPLYLAGLGLYLWTSVVVDETPNDTLRLHAHGPLLSLLGYLDAESRSDDGEESDLTLLLGGILWTSHSTSRDGETIDATHGPLWGVLGWGREDGEPTIRFLWFDIEV